jgi:hypothetical protein
MLGVGGEIPSSDSAEQLTEQLRMVLFERDQLSLLASAMAGELARIDYAEEFAAVSTADWIRHEFKLGYQAAADLVRVGLEMDSLPATVAAVQDAAIGFQHLVCMARTKAAVGSRPFEEARLLAEAKEASVGRFWHVCQQARHAADAAGVAREQALSVEARAFRINQQQDGMVTISGLLDPIGGTALRAALEPLAKKAGHDDPRDRERRLADALIELAQHAMDQATPRQRPHLNVTATVGTLYMFPGSASAEMEHGMPVSEVTVNRIACDCSITRHIFDAESVLIDLGRDKRVVSPKLRKALERRDHHCRWPGCTRPATWCEAHHLIPWMRGGWTNRANLVLLCTRHHWQVHEGRWQLLLHSDGRLEVVKPPVDFAAMPRAPACA